MQFRAIAGLLETKMTGFVLIKFRPLITRSFVELEPKKACSLCLTRSWMFPLYNPETLAAEHREILGDWFAAILES
jgi:hypothetical protein